MNLSNVNIAVVGLGYVGLPLACMFAKKYNVVGYDTKEERIKNINKAIDDNDEIPSSILQRAINRGFFASSNIEDIRQCNFYIITVPTPVDENNKVDLRCLLSATNTVAQILKKNDIVVYESTVYPGMTEEECVPLIERISHLEYNKDFFIGYSPERINPGDSIHSVETIKKVTSGSTPEIADFIDDVYNSVLENGTFKASCLKVAEAAKIIENTQRDVNIAFMNELAKIFNAMGIDTKEVIEAASSKWNFIKLYPGLVGGHCISVDPYYLIQKAEVYGLRPRLLMNARELNDAMGTYVANQVIKQMNKKGIVIKDSKILILGFTFKENCSDIRNTKVKDIYSVLKEYTDDITVFDPHANKEKVLNEYNINITNTTPKEKGYDCVVMAVAHKEFHGLNPRSFLKDANKGIVYDVKGLFDKQLIDYRL